jgi:hypothetical protein
VSARAITDYATVKAWAPPAQQETPDVVAVVRRCIEAATLTLDAACHRRFAAATYAAWHSGDRAAGGRRMAELTPFSLHYGGRAYQAGQRLYLTDPATGYLTAPVTAAPTVTENGLSLAAYALGGALPQADCECALYSPQGGWVMRAYFQNGQFVPKPWAWGFANVTTAWTAGYTQPDDTGAGTMPADIIQACCELAWMFYREGARNGLETLIQQGVNVTFVRLLSPMAQAIVNSYMLPHVPQTVER